MQQRMRMGDDFGPLRHLDDADFDPWNAPEADPFSWLDPDAERAAFRRRLRRLMLGFVLMALALTLASLESVVGLATLLLDLQPARMALQAWEFPIESAVVFGSFLGACFLWGRWPDASWQRRSGLLLMMCFTDIVLWSIDHAVRLGLSDSPFGHEYFRQSLGPALGWAQFALIAGLSADLATSLGETRAADLGRAVRSLIVFGFLVWVLRFYVMTDWRAPVWPLRMRPLRRGMLLPFFGSIFLSTIVLVQVTGICLLAAFVSYREVRRLDAEARRDDDAFPSRSEAAWDEWHSNDPDPDRRNR